MGLAGVLDDGQAVPVGDGRDRVHVGRQAEQVDRADRAGPRRDRRLDPRGVDVVGVGLDVDEDGRRPGGQDRADGRVERVADGDDLVARPEAEALEDAHQRDGAVADRDRVLRADEGREALLQLGDSPAAGEHPALEHLGHGGDLLRPDVRPGDRDHARHLGRIGSRSVTVDDRAVVIARRRTGESQVGHAERGRASAPSAVVDEALAADADPADPARRVADDERVRWHVTGHDGPRADHRVRPDVAAGDDDRAGPDRGADVDHGSG